MSIYRFPPMADIEEFKVHRQLDKIFEELNEANDAYKYETEQQFGIELLDIIQATETLLRMEFTEDEVEELRAKVVEKNAKRGYYKC